MRDVCFAGGCDRLRPPSARRRPSALSGRLIDAQKPLCGGRRDTVDGAGGQHSRQRLPPYPRQRASVSRGSVFITASTNPFTQPKGGQSAPFAGVWKYPRGAASAVPGVLGAQDGRPPGARRPTAQGFLQREGPSAKNAH